MRRLTKLKIFYVSLVAIFGFALGYLLTDILELQWIPKQQSYIPINCWNATTEKCILWQERAWCKFGNGTGVAVEGNYTVIEDFIQRWFNSEECIEGNIALTDKCDRYETIQVCCECLESSCIEKTEQIIESVWLSVRIKEDLPTMVRVTEIDNIECTEDMPKDCLSLFNYYDFWCCLPLEYLEDNDIVRFHVIPRIIEESKQSCSICRNSITKEEMSCE